MSTTDTPIDQLRELIRNLFDKDNEAERKALESDPEGFMASKGLSNVTPEQVDSCVAEIAPSYAASPHYSSVASHGGSASASASASAASASAAGAAAQQVVAHYDTIVQQYGDVTYVDQSQETYVDNSVNIDDLSAEGDIDLDLDTYNETDIENDNTSATDGGVAVGEGGSIDGPVNTGEFSGIQGDGNTVDDLTFGDGNTVTEDNDSTVFANNGDASNVEGDGNMITDIGDGNTNVAVGDGNTQTDNSINDSFNPDNSVDNSVNDSFDTEDSFNTSDSFNQDNDVTTDIDDHSTTVDTDVETNVDAGLL